MTRLAQVEQIPFDIEQRVNEAYALKQRVYPCRSNRASSLGHPCERYLVYMRSAWQEKRKPELTTEFIWEGGRVIEEHIAIPRLKAAGFSVTNQGRDFEDKKYQITGHVDCMLGDPTHTDGSVDAEYPTEIKGLSPFKFAKIHSAEDMLYSKDPWTRQYPAQLMLYLFLAEKPVGLFYIVDKLTFVGRPIWMALDYDFCEELIKKAERINAHVGAGTLPERTLDVESCLKCGFRHLCLPDLKNAEGVEVIINEETEEELDRLMELKPLAKEYDQIDKKMKQLFEEKSNVSLGKYYITGKWIEKTMPASEERKVRYWQKKIVVV